MLVSIALLSALGYSLPITSAGGGHVPTSALPGPSIAYTNLTTTINIAQFSPARNTSTAALGFNLAADNKFNSTDASLINGTSTRYWRYPSGVCGEGLNWTSGKAYGDLCYNNSIKITVPQFISDCEEVKCKAIMQLPTEINSSATAAYYVTWVEQTEHFTPAYFELGNEPAEWTYFNSGKYYGSCTWPNWGTSVCPGNETPRDNATPDTYAQVVKSYVAAIDATGSTVPIIGIGGVGQPLDKNDHGTPGADQAWAYAIYKAVGDEIAGLSVHDYPGRDGTPTSNASFFSTLVDNDTLLGHISETRAGILAACPSCTNAQILVSEGSVYTCGSCNRVYRNSFADALAMGAFATETFYYGAVNFDLESLYSGSLAGNWWGPATPEPLYYLYSDIFSHMPLANTSGNLLNVSQTSGPGMMWFDATYQSSGSWTLLVLNLNVTYGATLSITGFPTSGSFTLYTWTSSTAQPVKSTASSFTGAAVAPESMLLVTI
jgi:hypothetical protein